MASEQPRISVIDPIGPAIDRVKAMLFAPFDLVRWLVIGFCAWLANLGRGGLSGGFNFGFPGPGPRREIDFEGVRHHVESFFGVEMALIIMIGAFVFIVAVVVAILLLWLSSRGRFMFLHCVAQNKAEVKIPWRQYREQGNSLFLFRLAAGIIFFISVALFVVPILLLTGVIGRGAGLAGFGIIAVVIMLVLVLIPVGVIYSLILKFTNDFVVPIMYLRGSRCIEGWREYRRLLAANAGGFTLYILFQILIAMAISAIVAAFGFLTCCCGFFLLAIPYVGTVLMLPLPAFMRAYSLHYLAQFGPPFNVFAQAEPPAAPVPQAP
ncbi:MAG TPA: hypothetical protein VMX13_15250 [Sedimentisphaerales bacterium]|nr:hypothetical protein [Sedimentisphaerales bacterium]